MTGRDLIDWLEEITGRARRKRLEEELVRADAEIARLRTLLADATRPPTQFARMRQREVAMRRLGRLRLAGGGRATALAGRSSTSRSERYRTTPQ
jgi:hypothetical protein